MPDKVALITGASGGIGRATSFLAAQSGFTVGVQFHRHGDRAELIASRIRQRGGSAFTLRADLTVTDDVYEMFATADRHGDLAAFVNNAGAIGERSRGMKIDLARFQNSLSINLVAPFSCIKAAITSMLGHGAGGSIVNVSSFSVVTGGAKNHVDYAAAKAGLESLTRGFATEMEGTGIRVNTVSPGSVATGMWRGVGCAARRRIRAGIPARRFAMPSEIATAIVWLILPESRHVNGQIIRVDGGRTAPP